MPLYEYYCPPCGSQFEILRPVSKMDEPAVCPAGHTTNNRVLSLFAPLRRAAGGETATATADRQSAADDCCGGSCSCC